jgi:DNA polymerase-3 subunit beta
MDTSVAEALFSGVYHAVGDDEQKPHLAGVLLERVNDQELVAVATDGHRLACIRRESSLAVAPACIPKKGLLAALRLLGVPNEADKAAQEEEANPKAPQVKVAFDEKHVFFTVDGLEVMLSCKLLEAERFPDYESILPKKHQREVTANRLVLSAAMARVSVLSTKTGGIRIELRPGELTLVVEHPEHGDARDTIEVQFSGKPLTMGLSARYVRDALKVMDSEDVVLEFGEDLDPVLLRSNQDTFVVMPYRL